MPLMSGIRLGPYEILSAIGAGGMSEVYRARDTRLGRDVAVKVLPRLLATDESALARFEREAKVLAALSHPNLLAIHDFGVHDGTAYAVMELLEGGSLRERLVAGETERALPLRKVRCFSRHLVMMLWSGPSSSALATDGGSSCRIAVMVSAVVGRSNARWPAAISYNTHPNANLSPDGQ